MNLHITPVEHVPEIHPGTNLSTCLQQAIHASGFELQPADILATVYHVLGLDPATQFKDHTGRPVAILDEGRAIDELV